MPYPEVLLRSKAGLAQHEAVKGTQLEAQRAFVMQATSEEGERQWKLPESLYHMKAGVQETRILYPVGELSVVRLWIITSQQAMRPLESFFFFNPCFLGWPF